MGHSEDKSAAQRWARDLLGSKNWVILDTDHTGYGDDDTIIEVTVTDNAGTIIFRKTIPPKKSKGASFRALLNELNSVIAGKTVVTFNGEFRERIFEQTCDKWGCDWEFFDFECAMRTYSAYVGAEGQKR